MRIGIDARLLRYRDGGISQYTRRLVAGLAGLGSRHDFRLLQMRQHHEQVTRAAHFQRVGCWTPCHHRLERWALGLELLPHRLNVLHSPDFIPPAFGAERSVITVHDLNFLHAPEHLTPESRRYYRDQIAWAVRRADRVIAVSQTTRRDLVERLGVPEAKLAVVYEAAGPEFQPLPNAEIAPVLAKLGLEPGYLLFVGTLEPRKNLPVLLAAYASLRARRSATPALVLAGARGWLYDDVFAAAERLRLGSAVRFVERFTRAELAALYNGARALAMPTLYEGFGLPALEAMQSGTPVVVADRGALPEIAGEAGLRVDPQVPEAIAEALERLLDDDGLHAEQRVRGLARAAQFSWDRAARETLEQYELAAR